MTHRRIHPIGHIHRGLISHGESATQAPRQRLSECTKGQPSRLIGQSVRRSIERENGVIKAFGVIRSLAQVTRQQVVPQGLGGRLAIHPQFQHLLIIFVDTRLGKPPQLV